MYEGTMTGTWNRNGRIYGTNIGKGAVLRVIFEIGISSKRAVSSIAEETVEEGREGRKWGIGGINVKNGVTASDCISFG